MSELLQEIRAHKAFVGVVAAVFFVALALVLLPRPGNKPTPAPTGTTPTTTTPKQPRLPRPEIEVLSGRIVAHQKANSFTFSFPRRWTAEVTQNNGALVNIVLTPPTSGGAAARNDASILFERQQQEFLDLQGVKNGYFGGVDTARDYYDRIVQKKTTLGGKRAYYLSTRARGIRSYRVVYFTVTRLKSYSFIVRTPRKRTARQLAPTLQRVARSLRFHD